MEKINCCFEKEFTIDSPFTIDSERNKYEIYEIVTHQLKALKSMIKDIQIKLSFWKNLCIILFIVLILMIVLFLLYHFCTGINFIH